MTFVVSSAGNDLNTVIPELKNQGCKQQEDRAHFVLMEFPCAQDTTQTQNDRNMLFIPLAAAYIYIHIDRNQFKNMTCRCVNRRLKEKNAIVIVIVIVIIIIIIIIIIAIINRISHYTLDINVYIYI